MLNCIFSAWTINKIDLAGKLLWQTVTLYQDVGKIEFKKWMLLQQAKVLWSGQCNPRPLGEFAGGIIEIIRPVVEVGEMPPTCPLGSTLGLRGGQVAEWVSAGWVDPKGCIETKRTEMRIIVSPSLTWFRYDSPLTFRIYSTGVRSLSWSVWLPLICTPPSPPVKKGEGKGREKVA